MGKYRSKEALKEQLHKVNKSITLKNAYKTYEDFYKVGYKNYRNICEDFNKLIMDNILLKSQ